MHKRMDWVDYAKAIGIILVVYGHVARGVFNANIEMSEPLYLLVDSIIYSFHMPLFFFLSGLFFYQSFSKSGAKELTFKKIDTIVYPYLLWSVVQGMVEVVLSNYTNGQLAITEVLSLWDPRAQFWFLYALFVLFALCSVFYCMTKGRYTAALFVFSVVIYLVVASAEAFFIVRYIAQNLVYFVLGVFFYQSNLLSLISSRFSLFIFTALFILGQFLYHSSIIDIAYKQFSGLMLASISILFVASVSYQFTKVPMPFLLFIGQSSMSIYLMHILAGSGLRVVLSKFLGVDSAVLHLVLGTLAGILLPILALLVIQRFKIPYLFEAPISQFLKAPFFKRATE